jgi:polar amino acid transport system permease protein
LDEICLTWVICGSFIFYFMAKVETTSSAVRVWRSFRRCFWQSPEERLLRPAWWVVAINWVLAFFLLSLVAWYAFANLRYNWNWDAVSEYAGFFWRGWFTTIQVSALALVLSTVIGVIAALARRSGFFVLRALSRIYVETLRGTPLLVQISFAFYVIASAIRLENRFVVGVGTLAICYGAYIGEIVRGGIESIGASQLDSARAIGLSRTQTYRYVIFPQAIRVILPGLAGMFANLIKDSSLLSVISIGEFTWSAQQVGGLTYSLFETYIPLAVGYLVLTVPITLWTQWLERRTKFET